MEKNRMKLISLFLVALFSGLYAQDSTYIRKYAANYKLEEQKLKEADEQIKLWNEKRQKTLGRLEVYEKLFIDEKKKLDSLKNDNP
jgi:hypothetical protein